MRERHPIRGSLPERFWPKVDRSAGPEACWPWTGTQNASLGYGQIGRGGMGAGMAYAHRVSYELANGAIPDGMCVLHRCDNPPCVNPAHLYLGTIADNNRDAKAKGRTALGERNGQAKLTDEQVREIRRIHGSGGVTQRSLARKFGVQFMQISRIVNFQNRRTA